MKEMFCYQCQQTAQNIACEGKSGVCGKKSNNANLQDELTGALIGLSRLAIQNKKVSQSTAKTVIEALFTTVTNVNFNVDTVREQIANVRKEKEKLSLECNDIQDEYQMSKLWEENEDVRSLKSLILFGVRGMAAYAHHAMVLGYHSQKVNDFFIKALFYIGNISSLSELLPVVLETGEVNLECMELLDKAHTETFSNPIPTKVPLLIEKGPFIVVSGHDLYDLKLLLEQTKGKGVNVYTHSEMLPAHAYPKLKEYPHLKGNFGTAWQSQQTEFHNIKAPILFTTNCLMPIRESYKDRVFTTSVVSYEELVHIGDEKDFSPVIKKALECGGYEKDQEMTGINGGKEVMTGFSHSSVLSLSNKVVELVKSGKIKHFFLVGGCDGAAPGRSYYTNFVKSTPKDTIVLTLACGKYRFNDLDLGDIEGIPRIMDMGQCNDAYSAIKVAVALSEAFGCSVNELPLTMVLSWYEQKAVVILLTLLHLGIKDIFLGPTLPAFISDNILSVLVDKFNITPISDPETDLKKILS